MYQASPSSNIVPKNYASKKSFKRKDKRTFFYSYFLGETMNVKIMYLSNKHGWAHVNAVIIVYCMIVVVFV